MAGAGYKLFNTGDVLTAAQVNTYLMEQTVMVFADATARTTALSGVVSEGMISYLKDTNAVEVYDGSNWVSSDDPNAIQNTIVDAKGDLITATAADTPSRLAVGNSGDTLLADSSTSTGLRWQEPKAQNPILNSAMQIWQRGTSISLAAGAGTTYLADRWMTFTGANQACTVSRQATSDTTNLPFIQYALRYSRNSGQTGTGGLWFVQSFESANAIPFAGKTVTLSFYARKGANYSATSSLLDVYLVSGTGTDQNLISGYTGSNNVIASNATLTTTWQRFSFTATIPATATELSIQIVFNPTGTAGAADYYEITGLQLEAGSVATPFRTYAGTLAGELAACQRYYWRAVFSSALQRLGVGMATTTTIGSIQIPFPNEMRIRPTALEQNGTAGDYSIAYATGTAACNVVPAFAYATNYNATVTFEVASGLTVGQAIMFRNVNTNAYLGWSAEL